MNKERLEPDRHIYRVVFAYYFGAAPFGKLYSNVPNNTARRKVEAFIAGKKE